MAQKGFREKFQAAKLLFFPPKIEDTPRNAVKGRLKELMFTERYGVTPEDLEALRERVKQVVAEYLEMYPEDVHRTRLQPALKIKYDSRTKKSYCYVTFRVQGIKPNVLKKETDFLLEQLRQDEEELYLEDIPSSPSIPFLLSCPNHFINGLA
ncbi:hypothetical protein CYMTET_45235 [Cymbomonas tetramitiformis]|uniref:Uncharacterized protein n=1 Tax=Cymbomonas tetramitiformis TaxID=36881 RepID=A0AAE0EYT6_9CHLO|nr:hypothetical protein CYMTET_45235 [Cymbomonas tetramitiformis]